MRALIFNGGLKFTYEYPCPQRPAGESIVAVCLAGICATDLEIVKGYMGFSGVLGHEFVGQVIESDRKGLIGRRVVGEINCPCGACELCRRGRGSHCRARSVLGIQKRDGAFADFLCLPDGNLHPVPEAVSDREAVFVEPLAAACRAFEQAVPQSGERVVILGDGRLGLLIAAVFVAHGSEVTLMGAHRNKLLIAESWGAHVELEGSGCAASRSDIVVDATGTPAGLQRAMALVSPGGKIILKTTVAAPYHIALSPLVVDEITVIGSRCGPFGTALDLLAARRVDVRPMVTAEYPLEEGVEAFRRAGEGDALKVLLSNEHAQVHSGPYAREAREVAAHTRV